MPTVTDPQPLIDEAVCDACKIPRGMIWYVVLAALLDVANGDPVSTDPDELMDEARCLQCAMPAGFVPYAILNAVRGISGGGGGGGNNISGAGSPVGVRTPDAVNQFYRDTTGNTLWQSTGLTNLDWLEWI